MNPSPKEQMDKSPYPMKDRIIFTKPAVWPFIMAALILSEAMAPRFGSYRSRNVLSAHRALKKR